MTATATDRRYYSPSAARTMVATLRAWIDSSEESMLNAEGRGDDDRAGEIAERIDALEAALDALEGLDL